MTLLIRNARLLDPATGLDAPGALAVAAEFLLPGCAPLLVAGEGAPAAGVPKARPRGPSTRTESTPLSPANTRSTKASPSRRRM